MRQEKRCVEPPPSQRVEHSLGNLPLVSPSHPAPRRPKPRPGCRSARFTPEKSRSHRGFLRSRARPRSLRGRMRSRQAIEVGCERLGQDLERHITVELRVAGAVNLAQAASADLGRDIVVAESRADREGHRLCRSSRLGHSTPGRLTAPAVAQMCRSRADVRVSRASQQGSKGGLDWLSVQEGVVIPQVDADAVSGSSTPDGPGSSSSCRSCTGHGGHGFSGPVVTRGRRTPGTR